MSKYKQHLKESGYMESCEVLRTYPILVTVFDWTSRTVGTLVSKGVVKGKFDNSDKKTLVHIGSLKNLIDYMIDQRDSETSRLKEVVN